jgi:hypothetical protein
MANHECTAGDAELLETIATCSQVLPNRRGSQGEAAKQLYGWLSGGKTPFNLRHGRTLYTDDNPGEELSVNHIGLTPLYILNSQEINYLRLNMSQRRTPAMLSLLLSFIVQALIACFEVVNVRLHSS